VTSRGVVAPRPASSVVVLRPGDPFEVLLVRRRGGGTFGDLVVFPGGTVDESDRGRGGNFEDGAQRVAALRELAEETGLLALNHGFVTADGRGGEPLLEELDESGDQLAIESLVMISRWITPEAMPHRFDTWFYLLAADDVPDVVIDERELTGFQWAGPAEALDRARAGEWRMILPTLTHLRWLSRRRAVEQALEEARGADGRTLVLPRVEADGSLVPVLLPEDGA